MRITLILPCVLVTGTTLVVGACAKGEAQPQQQAGAPAATPVTVGPVVRKSMPLEASVVGTVEAYSTVSVRAQITGELTAVRFQQGDDVTEGQELFTLDRRPLEGALLQAEANLERDTAEAANAKAIVRALRAARPARHRGARAARQRAHQRRQARSDAGVGPRRGRERESAAAVRDDQGADFRPHRRADGERRQSRARQRSGAARHDQPGQPHLRVVLVPEPLLPDLRRYQARGSLGVEARPASGDDHIAIGTITFIDNAVDLSTGTIKVKATFPNDDRQLWPGQFVNVVVRSGHRIRRHRRADRCRADRP